MPALRKRKSRTGTPFDSTTDSPPSTLDLRKEKVQSSLDAWVEPALQNPAPSFEEHGLIRHGVLETMAPLGVPPSTKIKQKARASGDTNMRRSLVIKKGGALAVEEDGTTPELTPAPELERDDSERQEEDITVSFPDQDEDEDDDYMPSRKKAKTSHGTKTPVRSKSVAQTKPTARGKTPVKNGMSKSNTTTPVASSASAVGLGCLDQTTQQRIHIAVNDAISRSNKNNTKDLGVVLKEMLVASQENTQLAKAVDGVMHQKETIQEYAIFRQFVKGKKKQIKLGSKLQKAQNSFKSDKAMQKVHPVAGKDEDSSPPTGLPTASNSPPSGYGSPALDLQSTAAPTIEADRANGVTSEKPASETGTAKNSVAGTPHPLASAPAFPVAEASTPPARKMASKSPRKQVTRDALGSKEVPKITHTPATKSPDAGSDSALSDVDDELINRVEAPKNLGVNSNGVNAATIPKKAKNAALARAGKKSKANSTKPLSKPKEKLPLTPEQLAEQAEIEKKRQKYVDEQSHIRDHMMKYAPTSDTRFDDEILDTESLTESQIAVGPPVDMNRPRRAGRQPRNGYDVHAGDSKRSLDFSRFSSPRPDSVATSRPSTPAASTFGHVPYKRVKLNNGQAHHAARTKKSPVKNRDGPIAGIPHNGGGGSRHSGPDDNDPSSPPSETDDLCSACKGAGEFVICDHCPRVFHFLCCDPPMLEAPTGHFSCYECSSKLKHVEEPAVDSYPALGPLFKSLESINTRAFALPSSIQNHFENVSARLDGSYVEETKKFPLSKSSGYGYQRPDYTKVFDGDKAILCVQCGLTSSNKRQMLKCDFCAVHWHLDCLDPPLANPPHINLESAQRDAWRCPRHIEHDLRSGSVVQNDLDDAQDCVMMDAPRLGRKVRKPRHPQVVQPTFSRGMRNNGLIDIINDPDDDTDGEGNYVFGNDEKDFNSHVYRIPEKGIVLDFIDKVKSGNVVKKQKLRADSLKAEAQRKSSIQALAARPIEQQQAALNLARLAKKEQDVGLTESNIDALVLTLTAEAPRDVVAAISDAPPPPMSADERAQLLKLQQLINIRLGNNN
ncbi:unnamed protein product [Periconia digitata]|uniref:PHD-type domain-containing protein n=1 Tax=Periconia digitata TaxID=1303443 RepID=A0A9W4XNI6_9PLEO|nr:unnamed protein product [Periconia digitata]